MQKIDPTSISNGAILDAVMTHVIPLLNELVDAVGAIKAPAAAPAPAKIETPVVAPAKAPPKRRTRKKTTA